MYSIIQMALCLLVLVMFLPTEPDIWTPHSQTDLDPPAGTGVWCSRLSQMIHFTHVCPTTIVVIPPIPSHPSILSSLHPFLSAPPPLMHLQIKVDQMSPLEITVPSKLLTFMAHGGIRIPSWLLEPEVRQASRWLMWVSQANAAQSGLKPKLQHLSGVKGVCCASTHLLWVYQIMGPAWFVPGGDIQMHVYLYTHTHTHLHTLTCTIMSSLKGCLT